MARGRLSGAGWCVFQGRSSEGQGSPSSSKLASAVPILLGSRPSAGAAGFLILSQYSDRPERYGEPSRFDTIPSQPSLQAIRPSNLQKGGSDPPIAKNEKFGTFPFCGQLSDKLNGLPVFVTYHVGRLS